MVVPENEVTSEIKESFQHTVQLREACKSNHHGMTIKLQSFFSFLSDHSFGILRGSKVGKGVCTEGDSAPNVFICCATTQSRTFLIMISTPPPSSGEQCAERYLAQNQPMLQSVIDLTKHVVPVVQVSLSGIFREHTLKSNLQEFSRENKQTKNPPVDIDAVTVIMLRPSCSNVFYVKVLLPLASIQRITWPALFLSILFVTPDKWVSKP